MGYRSEVAILLNDAAVKRMTDELKKTFEETFTPPYDTVRKLDDGCMLYHTRSYKWYAGYEEVDAIEKFLGSLSDDSDDGAGGEFLRIGEDKDDIEHHEYGNWDEYRLWVETYISLEGLNIEANEQEG